MNPRLQGKNRDNQILRTIEEYRALDTQQVYQLFHFDQISFGMRKAQERLFKLHKTGKLGRQKLGEGSYAYWTQKPPNLAHTVALNWVRMWQERHLASWERLHCFTYEKPSYDKILRPDAFVAVKTKVPDLPDKFHFRFIELDLATNPFDKVEKYTKLFTGDKWLKDWWVRLSARFPPILIVTVRPVSVERLIEEQNSAGLEFVVKDLEEIKREVKGNAYNIQAGTSERRVAVGAGE